MKLHELKTVFSQQHGKNVQVLVTEHSRPAEIRLQVHDVAEVLEVYDFPLPPKKNQAHHDCKAIALRNAIAMFNGY